MEHGKIDISAFFGNIWYQYNLLRLSKPNKIWYVNELQISHDVNCRVGWSRNIRYRLETTNMPSLINIFTLSLTRNICPRCSLRCMSCCVWTSLHPQNKKTWCNYPGKQLIVVPISRSLIMLLSTHKVHAVYMICIL